MADEDTPGLFKDEDGISRCWWCAATPLYQNYHDHEWGFPVTDDQRLFEKISLEGFQAGLSWLTILNKRENFRRAFRQFDFCQVAQFGTKEVDELLQNKGIVRHRGKIEAVIGNAQKAIDMVAEFGSLAAFFWRYEPLAERSEQSMTYERLTQIAQTPDSQSLSRELKKRGWRFVGPTTMYAFMQAMGLVNDHLPQCASYELVENARRNLCRPA